MEDVEDKTGEKRFLGLWSVGKIEDFQVQVFRETLGVGQRLNGR